MRNKKCAIQHSTHKNTQFYLIISLTLSLYTYSNETSMMYTKDMKNLLGNVLI